MKTSDTGTLTSALLNQICKEKFSPWVWGQWALSAYRGKAMQVNAFVHDN